MVGIGERWRRGWLRFGRILFSLNNLFPLFEVMSVATLEKPGVKPKLKPLVVSAELLARAAEAVPSSGSYGKHFQVFCVIMRSGRGHKCSTAAEWFVTEGYIAEADYEKFYLAMRMRWQRENKGKEGA